MAEWRKKALGDITGYISKGIPPAYTDKDSTAAICVLNQKCNKNFDISYEDSRYHDVALRKVPSEKMLRAGDVLINSTGEGTAGRVAQIFQIPVPTTIDGHMIVMRPTDEVDSVYYGYAIKNCQKKIESIAEGSTGQTEINRRRLQEEVLIKYPVDKDIQKAIGHFLFGIDEKIRNNRKINDNLQQQAMALYAEMFLNSSDNNVTSGTLSDIAVITMGQSPSGSSYNEDGVGEVFYQGRAEFGFRFPKRRLFTTEPKRMAETGDVLLSVRAPVGDLNVAYESCCIGRGLGAIHSKTGHSSFVLYTMFALKSQLDVFNGEGTVFGSINRDALNAIPIDVPLVTKIDRFEAVAHPIDELIRTNYEENCRLEAIRDSLLPKLMSGEIDVSAVQL